VFYNEGWVEPDTSASFGDAGNLSFDLRTGGGESGLNFAGSQRFNFGLILGRSELKQRLRAGIGSDAIKGNVYGGYGTMTLPGGFYLDLSHRRLSFDADLDAGGTELRSGGEADTSNMETGYSFMTKNNLGIQVQYQQTITRITSIDTLDGPLAFDGDGGRSSLTRLGAEVRKTWDPTPKGTVWLGRVIFNAVREFDGTSRYDIGDDISGKVSVEGTSYRIEAGASARRGNFLVFGSLTYESGGALHDFFGGQVGGRWVW
jgi:outer membrane autotransporter protein